MVASAMELHAMVSALNMFFLLIVYVFLLGQERSANPRVNGKIALLVPNVVLIATQTTGGQALGIVGRAGVETAGGTFERVLQAKDASGATGCCRAG
jgi:hypothetical protein